MPYCKKCGTKLDDDAVFCPNCGTPVSLTKKEKPKTQNPEPDTGSGTMLNVNQVYGRIDLERLPEGHIIDERYEIVRKLGQGSFGAVYLAYDRHMEIEKALKVIPEAVSNDKEAMLSLKKEASIMVKLNHKNIVRVYDFHDSGTIKYIDMEYVDGTSLADLKLEKPGKKFPEAEVKQYALQIAEGLAYAHNKKVIHKDIKPQNMMLTKEGVIKLMDFGIAETVHSSMSRLKNTGSSGTLVYMSPEQLRGKDVGKEADIYSLGATLYELLSGNPPFYQGDISYQIINEQAEPIDGVSEQMNSTILKCLEKDRTKRFSDCTGLISVLKEKAGNRKNKNIPVPGEPVDVERIKEEGPDMPEKPVSVKTIKERGQKEQSGEKKELTDDLIEMVFVEGGTFEMGSNKGDSDEKPVHKVTVNSFYMGKYEVTQKQWKAIMGNNPSYFKGDDLPVENVSWNDVQEFIKKLNQTTGQHYRLPTEAEWEYAARGGNESRGYKYSGSNNIDEVAWYDKNSGNHTHQVGTKAPNELGIYDMTGNVWEWCSDWYNKNYYRHSPQNNPQGPASGKYRVLRGGSWLNLAGNCRVANRYWYVPDFTYLTIGFRVVR